MSGSSSRERIDSHPLSKVFVTTSDTGQATRKNR